MADDVKKNNDEENKKDQEKTMSDKEKLIDKKEPKSSTQPEDGKQEIQNSDDSKSEKEPGEDKEKLIDEEKPKSSTQPEDNEEEKQNSDDSKSEKEPDEDQNKENSKKSSDHSDLEEPNEQEEFLKKQKKLLEHVSDIEKKQTDKSEVRPCNSCELLKPYRKDNSCCAALRFCRRKKTFHKLFWIVSVPADPNPQEAFNKLKEETEAEKLSFNYKFHIPQLKIGTLDELMYLTEELKSLDSFTKDIIHRFIEFVHEVSESTANAQECFVVDNMDVATYITRFTWNEAKYAVKKPLSVLNDLLRAEMRRLGENLKIRMDEYRELDRNLDKIEKQQTGSLVTRSLAGIVKREHFILDSGYLTTLLVVVPKQDEKNWLNSYQGFADMVVPKSAMKIFEDKNQMLYSVVLCKKSMEDFKNNAREQRFIVRDFEYHEEELAEEKDIRKKLQNMKKSQIAILRRWIKVNFSEGFASWMHIKAMVVLVESALRYGLPLNFQAVILIPLKGKEQLRTVLDELYGNLDSDLSSGTAQDVPGALAAYGVTHYAPYVFSKIKFDAKLSKKKDEC